MGRVFGQMICGRRPAETTASLGLGAPPCRAPKERSRREGFEPGGSRLQLNRRTPDTLDSLGKGRLARSGQRVRFRAV